VAQPKWNNSWRHTCEWIRQATGGAARHSAGGRGRGHCQPQVVEEDDEHARLRVPGFLGPCLPDRHRRGSRGAGQQLRPDGGQRDGEAVDAPPLEPWATGRAVGGVGGGASHWFG
jgi:hypothetical protein